MTAERWGLPAGYERRWCCHCHREFWALAAVPALACSLACAERLEQWAEEAS